LAEIGEKMKSLEERGDQRIMRGMLITTINMDLKSPRIKNKNVREQ
jgi:hypothetical protein